MPRLLFPLAVLAALLAAPAARIPLEAQAAVEASTLVDAPRPFEEWLDELIEEARNKGFADPILQNTLIGLTPLPQVIQSDRNQAEGQPSFTRYLNQRLTRAMTDRGKTAVRQHQRLLDRIEAAFGVQRRFLVAIWGLESRFGQSQGRTPVFQALATLAWEPRRATFFRGELFNALTMVDRGYIEPATMTGSWAGAMGQTQFMPSSYLSYAVDFDEDGRRDIWSSTDDALASIANYLKGFGWDDQYTWGREVRVSAAARTRIDAEVPKQSSGCSARRAMTERRPLAAWQTLGVRTREGGALPKADVMAALVEVGNRHFLVYPNYDAILAYNCSNFYALSVTLLGDSFR